MKNFIRLFALLTAFSAVSSLKASVILTPDFPFQTGMPGQTLTFSFSIFNSGDDIVYLNSNSLNLAGGSFSVQDLFFDNAPLYIEGGQTVSAVPLFTVLLNNPFSDPIGAYIGTYDLLGGIDGDAQDILASATFIVNAVPEPATGLVLAGALAILFAVQTARRSRGNQARI